MCERGACARGCPPPLLASLDFAYSPTEGARAALGAVRLAYGVLLAAFTAWAWADLSSSAAFGDANGGGFGRTATQVTNWGLLITVVYFLAVGAAALGARALGADAAPRSCARGAALCAPAALLAAAFALEVAITAIAWAAEDVAALRGKALASFIIKHTVLAPLLLDVALGRVLVPWQYGAIPVGVLALYFLAAGMYSVAQHKTPYADLSGFPGRVVAACLVALAATILGFALLKGLIAARENALAWAAAAPTRARAAPAPAPQVHVAADRRGAVGG